MIDASTFAQRFEFARTVHQRMLNTWQDDTALAAQTGLASSRITEYKDRDEAPPAKRTLALAQAIGVDPGWLAFGEASKAPAPTGFDTWLENRRATPHVGGAKPIGVIPGDAMIPVPRPTKRGGRRKAK